MLSTLAALTYNAAVQPYKNRLTNMQEIFNEATVLVAAYPLLTFTLWIWELDHKKNVGWFLVALIILNVLANIGLLTFIACRDFVLKYKVFRVKIIKQQRAKAAQELQKRNMAEAHALAEKKKAEAQALAD